MIIISELGKLSWVLAPRSAMWFVGDVTADVTSLGLSRSLVWDIASSVGFTTQWRKDLSQM